MGTNRGASKRGAPGGRNKLKKNKPCLFKPKIFKPINEIIPKLKVKKM